MPEGSQGQAKRSPWNVAGKPLRPERARDISGLSTLLGGLASIQDAVLSRTIPGAALRLPLATFSHPYGMPGVDRGQCVDRPVVPPL
jgi:hypothetical protein